MSEIGLYFLIPPILIIIIVWVYAVAHCCSRKNRQRSALQQARARAPPPQPLMTLTLHQRQFMEAIIQQAFANIDPSLQRQYIDFTMEQLRFAPGTVEENRQAELEQQRILQQLTQHTQHHENSSLGANTSADNVNGSLNTVSCENRYCTIPVTTPKEGLRDVPLASRQDTEQVDVNNIEPPPSYEMATRKQ